MNVEILLDKILHINWWYVIGAIAILFIVVQKVWSSMDWILSKFGIETKRMRQKREDREQLMATTKLAKTTAENLKALQERHCEDEEEFRKSLNDYMEESRKDRKALHDEMTAYKELGDVQNKMTDKVEGICKKLDDMEEKENKRVQSEIKERIAQSYRQYNASKQISDMELEALEDLIETYEAHGGENSFVHSVVQKEMYTWEVKY